MTDDKLDLAAFREQLDLLREELLAVAATGDDAAATVELDQSRVGRLSRMDAMQAQAMSQDGRRRREAKLRGVARALRRIEDDDFGWCEDCGEAIHARRLMADPTATLCVACATEREG